MVFLESMVDKSFLTSHTSYAGVIRRPMMSSGMGMMMLNYPSSSHVTYDASSHSSKIEIDGFTQ